MKIYYLKRLVWLPILSFFLFVNCGGNKANQDFFDKAQTWIKVEESDGNQRLGLSSYDVNEIDGIPMALALWISEDKINNSPLIFFTLNNVSQKIVSGDTLEFNKSQETINLKNQEFPEGIATFVLIPGSDPRNIIIMSNTDDNRKEELENILAYILNSEDLSVTAKLNNNKEYSWHFHPKSE